MPSINEDLNILSIRSATEHLDATVKRVLKRMDRQQQLKNAKLFNEVRDRKRIAKALRLEQHISMIFDALLHDKSLQLAPKESGIPSELSACLHTIDASGSTAKFILNDKSYKIVKGDSDAFLFEYDGDVFGQSQLTLFCEDEKVFAVNFDLAGESQRITDSQVVCFVPGYWIYDIVHAVQTIDIGKKLSAIDKKYSPDALDELKERFGIVEK